MTSGVQVKWWHFSLQQRLNLWCEVELHELKNSPCWHQVCHVSFETSTCWESYLFAASLVIPTLFLRQQAETEGRKKMHSYITSLKYKEKNLREKIIIHPVQTFRYFPGCLAGFSPGSFLSNFPPLAVAAAAIPATFSSSCLLAFSGTSVFVPVMGNAVAASWTWLPHEKPCALKYDTGQNAHEILWWRS